MLEIFSRIKTSQILLSFFTLAGVLAGCHRNALQGNAEGYNGGDLIGIALSAARARLVEGLKTAKTGETLAAACDFTRCTDPQSKFCGVLRNLSAGQVLSCRNFITAAIEPMLQLNRSGSETPFEFRFEPIKVGSRTVDAMTELGPQGAIIFLAEAVQRLAEEDLVALLFHEFGHKTLYGESYIEDDPALGEFTSGRDFLDTVASAFVALHERPSPVSNPRQLPTVATRHWYRSYDTVADAHFYTYQANEHTVAIANGYTDESNSSPFVLYAEAFDGALPVFRLFKASMKAHYYTTDSIEKDARVQAGWVLERVEGYVMAKPCSGAREIYTLQRMSNGLRLFTTSLNERNAVLYSFGNAWIADVSLGFTAP